VSNRALTVYVAPNNYGEGGGKPKCNNYLFCKAQQRNIGGWRGVEGKPKCNSSKIALKFATKTVKITKVPQKSTAICTKNESTQHKKLPEILS
jgi:hypothetical protein